MVTSHHKHYQLALTAQMCQRSKAGRQAQRKPADRHGACKTEPPRDAIGGQIFLALDSRQG